MSGLNDAFITYEQKLITRRQSKNGTRAGQDGFQERDPSIILRPSTVSSPNYNQIG